MHAVLLRTLPFAATPYHKSMMDPSFNSFFWCYSIFIFGFVVDCTVVYIGLRRHRYAQTAHAAEVRDAAAAHKAALQEVPHTFKSLRFVLVSPFSENHRTYGAQSSCCWSKTRQNCVRLQGPVRNGESRQRVGECCQSCSREASGLCFYRNWCMVATTPRIQVAFISIPSGIQLKSVRWMLRSNQSAKSWNLPVSRRIVSVVKWILPDIFTIQTSVFEDVFTIFYNLLHIFTILYNVLYDICVFF